jgi:hypothetical protein
MLSLGHRYLVCSPLFVSFLQARQRSGTLASTPGLLGHPVRLFRVAHKEASGSPKSPGYPFECMPRSPTPVVSSVLALSYLGLLPSTRMTVSAFPSNILTVIQCENIVSPSTTIQISRLNHAACILAPPGFGRLLPDLPAGFATSLLARLWLDGIFTRWIVSTNFINACLIPSFWV